MFTTPIIRRGYFITNIMDVNKTRSILKQFFRVNHTNNTVFIDFDSMCMFLVKDCKRHFSPSRFEKVLEVEVQKLKGKIISPEMFDRLAEYVDNMTLYIQQEERKLALERQKKVENKLVNFHKNKRK